MHVVAFFELGPDSTAAQVLAASVALRDAGVAGVGFLDAADLGVEVAALESSTLASLVALQVPGLGVIGSASALYGYPYHSARRFATLDHFAAGFSGLLLRTSTEGPEAEAHDWRSDGVAGHDLARAAEHVEIGFRLWDSWEDGAQWPDKETGDFKDDARIHAIDYATASFQVEGPLDVPPSPQGRPVVFAVVTSAEQVAALAPWVDVAVVRAAEDGAASALVEAVRADGRIDLVLLAAERDGLDLAGAEALTSRLGADGVAAFLEPGEARETAVAALARPVDEAPRSFAERLGLDPLPRGARTP